MVGRATLAVASAARSTLPGCTHHTRAKCPTQPEHVSHGVPPTRMSRDLAARRKHRSSSRRPAAAATASWEADKKNHPSTDVFDILGIDRRSSTEQIKQAYRRKARELHPDVNASENATAEFLELRRAYNALVEDWKRVLDLTPAVSSKEMKAHVDKINREMIDMFNSGYDEIW
eukprot:jgi/Tetstr1/436588/TSEL_025385.t1